MANETWAPPVNDYIVIFFTSLSKGHSIKQVLGAGVRLRHLPLVITVDGCYEEKMLGAAHTFLCLQRSRGSRPVDSQAGRGSCRVTQPSQPPWLARDAATAGWRGCGSEEQNAHKHQTRTHT